ncbi:hypothetical protein [Trichormus azollae]|jgi:hypothetical protein|nr:hypothetical protein [Trichormus azollae]
MLVKWVAVKNYRYDRQKARAEPARSWEATAVDGFLGIKQVA